MTRIISAFPHPIAALEIGSWFGEGSTAIWIEHLKPGSSLTLLDAWRPYASSEDMQADPGTWAGMATAATDAFLSTYLACRRHELRAAHRQVSVNLVRALSTEFLPLFADGSFDFIYVDGDHKYVNVRNDLAHAKRLVKKSGAAIICGDDLEIVPSPDSISLAQKYLDRDYVDGFHPGVLLAVAEAFGSVAMDNGFWWTVVRDGVSGIE